MNEDFDIIDVVFLIFVATVATAPIWVTLIPIGWGMLK